MQAAFRFLKQRSEALLNLGAWNTRDLGSGDFVAGAAPQNDFKHVSKYDLEAGTVHADASAPALNRESEKSEEVAEQSSKHNSQTSADWSLELLAAKKKAFFVLGQKMGQKMLRSSGVAWADDIGTGTALLNPDFQTLKSHYSAKIQETLERCQIVILPTPEKILWQLLGQGQRPKAREQKHKAWDWQKLWLAEQQAAKYQNTEWRSHAEDLCQLFAFLREHRAVPQQNAHALQAPQIKAYCSEIVLLVLHKYLYDNEISGFRDVGSNTRFSKEWLVQDLELHFGFIEFCCVETAAPALAETVSAKRRQDAFASASAFVWGRWHFAFVLEPISHLGLTFLRTKVSGLLDCGEADKKIAIDFELGRKHSPGLPRASETSASEKASALESELVYDLRISKRSFHYFCGHFLFALSLFQSLCFRVWQRCIGFSKSFLALLGKKSTEQMALALQYLAQRKMLRRLLPAALFEPSLKRSALDGSAWDSAAWDTSDGSAWDKQAAQLPDEARKQLEAPRVPRPISAMCFRVRSLQLGSEAAPQLAAWSVPAFQPTIFGEWAATQQDQKEQQDLGSSEALLDKETLLAAWLQERDCWQHLQEAAERCAALSLSAQRPFCLLLEREVQNFLAQIEERLASHGLQGEDLQAKPWRRGFHAKEAALRPLLRFRDAKHFWCDFFGRSRAMPFPAVLLWQLWSQLEPGLAKKLQKKRPIRSFLRANSAGFERDMGQLAAHRELRVRRCLHYKESAGSLNEGRGTEGLAQTQKIDHVARLSFGVLLRCWRNVQIFLERPATLQGARQWTRLSLMMERQGVIRGLGWKSKSFRFWPDWPEALFVVAEPLKAEPANAENMWGGGFGQAFRASELSEGAAALSLSPALFFRAKVLLNQQRQVFQRMAKLESVLQDFVQRNMRDAAFANAMLSLEAKQQSRPSIDVAAFVASFGALGSRAVRAWLRTLVFARTSWANASEFGFLLGNLAKAGSKLALRTGIRGFFGGLAGLRRARLALRQVSAASFRAWQQFCDVLQRARLVYWSRRALWAERQRDFLQRARQRRLTLATAREARRLRRVHRFRVLYATVASHFHLQRSRRRESNLAKASLRHQRLYERSIAKLERQRARETVLQKNQELKQQRVLQWQERRQLFLARWSDRFSSLYRPVAKSSYAFSMFCKRNRKSVAMALGAASFAVVALFIVPREFYQDTWASARAGGSKTLASIGGFGTSVGRSLGQGFRSVQVFVQGFSETAEPVASTASKPEENTQVNTQEEIGGASEDLLALQGSANRESGQTQAEPPAERTQAERQPVERRQAEPPAERRPAERQTEPPANPAPEQNTEAPSSGNFGRARQVLEDQPDFEATVTREAASPPEVPKVPKQEPEPISEQAPKTPEQTPEETPTPTAVPATSETDIVEPPSAAVSEPSRPNQEAEVASPEQPTQPTQPTQSSGNTAGNSFERLEMLDAPEAAEAAGAANQTPEASQKVPQQTSRNPETSGTPSRAGAEGDSLLEEGGFQPVPLLPKADANKADANKADASKADVNRADANEAGAENREQGELLEKPEPRDTKPDAAKPPAEELEKSLDVGEAEQALPKTSEPERVDAPVAEQAEPAEKAASEKVPSEQELPQAGSSEAAAE